MIDADRGTGRTTKQLESLKHTSLFIWHDGPIDYLVSLMSKIDPKSTFSYSNSKWTKSDGTIVYVARRSWLKDPFRYHGLIFYKMEIDHGLKEYLTPEEWDSVQKFSDRVRPEDRTFK